MAGQADIGALVVTLEAQTAAFDKGMAQATKSLNSFGSASKTVEKTLGGFMGPLLQFNQAIAGVGNAMGVVTTAFNAFKTLAAPRDQLRNLESSFKGVFGSGERAADIMGRVMRISNELGTSIPQTADALRRMSIGLLQLGASNDEIETITTTFLKLGAQGGSIQEATGAIFQFSQALGSGVLRGDELISLLERQPLIAQKIAQYMKSIGQATEGTTGELRKLAAEGKVTSQILRDALLGIAPLVAQEYAQMPLTMEKAINRMSNSWFKFRVDFAEATSLNEGIGKSFTALTGILDELFTLMIQDTKTVVSMFTQLGKAIETSAPAPETKTAWDDFLSFMKRELVDVSKVITDKVIGIFSIQVGQELFGSYAKLLGAQKDYNFELSNGKTYWDQLLNTALGALGLIESATDRERKRQRELNQAMAQDIENGASQQGKFNTPPPVKAKKNEAWDNFVEGLKKAREEMDLITPKIKYLEALLAKAPPNSTWAQKLTADIKALKESIDPADTALKAYAKTVQDSLNPLNQYTEELNKLSQAYEKGYLTFNQYADKQFELADKVNEAMDKTQKTKSALDEIGVAIGNTLSNSVSDLTDVLFEADQTFQKFAENFLRAIAKMIVQMMILKALKMSMANTAFGSFLGFAKGDSFEGGTSLKQGVYTEPTLFKFANGGTFGTRNGLMGEAGPEAILPLKRGANGQLGVQAGGSMEPPETIVNVYNSADATVKTSETTNGDGSKTIDIMIEKKVKELFGTGAMDKSMRASYGLIRSAA
jgi:tape measure domain-containing protein